LLTQSTNSANVFLPQESVSPKPYIMPKQCIFPQTLIVATSHLAEDLTGE
jgi:hypothetical protein